MSCSTTFDAIAPQYASDSAKETYLSIAEGRTSSCFFGDNYCLAVALRAAHMMVLRDRRSGSPGAASSKREGGLAISYSQAQGGDPDLGQTHYGRQLEGLIKGQIPAVGLTGGGVACTGGSY
jgi:hypothetical protein